MDIHIGKMKLLTVLWIISTALTVIQGSRVRLVGDSTNSTGRLEVLYKNVWIAVSSGALTGNDVKVVCRMLGYSKSGIAVSLDFNSYTQGSNIYGYYTGQYISSSFNCLGNETDISKCGTSSSYWYPNTVKNSKTMTVVSCEESQIRLVDGDSTSSGRVEIYIKDDWHTICDTNFDANSAKVVCSMLGYKDTGVAVPVLYSSYGQGYGHPVLTDLNCVGNEKDIKECRGNWCLDSCTHRNDAGVRCAGTEIRLVNGPDPASGRVEVKHAGEWGTICGDTSFDHRDVMVICRMLGYNNTNAFGFSKPFYGEGTGRVAAKTPYCDGSESDIAQCPSLQWDNAQSRLCSHSSDVGVNCNGRTQMRLTGGYSNQSGRLEIFHNGHWGTVSSRGFTDHDLMVVCRSLGFEYSDSSFYSTTTFGAGLGEIVLRNLDCLGNEHDIGQCNGEWMPKYTQGHDYDIGVSCDGYIPIRLAGGVSNASGRVEVMQNGHYGTVCSEGFDRADLVVICRMLGFENIPSTAYWRVGADFGQGLGVIAVSDLQCNGIESTIGKCGGTWPADRYYCDSHFKDVSISCDGGSERLRLVGGPTNYTGRVEIFHDGEWGKICEDDFDRPDAVVICRALGFPKPERAVAQRFSSIQNANSTAIATDLKCNGGEDSLEECRATWFPKKCYYGNDAAVNCCPACAATQIIG